MATSSSNSEEEVEKQRKKRKQPPKMDKKGRKRCYMHLSSVQGSEDVRDFTRTRWDTYRTRITQWLSLQGENKDIAETYKHCVDIDFDNVPEDAGFHITCFQRFSCKKRLGQVQRKRERDVAAGQSDPSATSTSETPRKKLCSRSGLPVPSAGPLLPPLCIICKKRTKYITVAGKRTRDPLTQAETLTAGRLQKAAELKDDSSVLLHIKDKDCVALEVRYYRSCFRNYTRFLTRPTATSTATQDEEGETLFADSYKFFCETVISQRIVVNQEVLKMDKLRKTFVNIVKNQEGLDASDYRQDLLKRWLTRDFPQLAFHQPPKKNICELVYVETLSADKLLDKLARGGTLRMESWQ